MPVTVCFLVEKGKAKSNSFFQNKAHKAQNIFTSRIKTLRLTTVFPYFTIKCTVCSKLLYYLRPFLMKNTIKYIQTLNPKLKNLWKKNNFFKLLQKSVIPCENTLGLLDISHNLRCTVIYGLPTVHHGIN